MDILERFENDAALKSKPNIGAEDLIVHLKSKQIKCGIITRNSYQSVDLALENFHRIDINDFDLIITRDDPIPPKPDPEGIRHALRYFGLDKRQMLLVGDFKFDMAAGHQAGIDTVFIDNGVAPEYELPHVTDRISVLPELRMLVRKRIALAPGKLPNDLLEEFIGLFGITDPSLIIKPGIGEDTAAVDIQESEVVVLKTDPITFVTDAIGYYAVLINANDIVTAGADPRWFLTSLLFPVGATASFIQEVMTDLHNTCKQHHITLCGGHTEITDAVNRPVVTGMMVGTVLKKNLIDKGRMRPGDHIFVTKFISVEGTAIISMEFGEKLKNLGLSEPELEKCKNRLSMIPIIREAKIAAGIAGVSGMHDVTEGGISTALLELGIAGKHRLRIEVDRIPIDPLTQKVSDLVDIDPLGLIGSGSLLITCRPTAARDLEEKINRENIDITCIGEVSVPGRGIDARDKGRPVDWPVFEVDEITKLF
jgi:hydrogenase maturation factor/beta-phosphoglucomutase-like phosphatase (HAD superfamily)